jgi:hypothetical protein
MLSKTKSRNAGKTLLHNLFFFLLVTQICFGQWVPIGLEDKGIKDIAARNSNIFAVTSDSGMVYRSTDNGITWLQIVDSNAVDIAISPTGSLFLVAEDSLYKSSDNGNTWVNLNIIDQLPPPPWYNSLTKVTVSPLCFVFCSYKMIGWRFLFCAFALSMDAGSTWTPSDTLIGGDQFDFRASSVITTGYAVSWDAAGAAVDLSSDNGQTWSYSGDPAVFGECSVLSMSFNGNIFMGTSGDLNGTVGLFLSSDSCDTWTQVCQLIPEAGLTIESGGLLVGTDSLGLFLFSDNGDSLGSFNEGLTNLNTHTLSMDNNGYVYVGTDNGLWRRPLSEIVPVELTSFTATTNGKEVILNWSTATELNNQLFEVQRSFEGSDFATVGFVNGKGTTTERQDYSYSDEVFTNGKYSYRLKQIDYLGSYEYSDVVEVDFRTFNSYLLERCYPNPFNPTTTIGFGIQNKSNVKITILNAIGEEVAVVLNEEREAGFHQVEFNAAGLPSGVYFYQLKAGEFISTKKMILLK